VPTTIDRQKHEARRMFRDHPPFTERVTLFLEFLTTGSCELRTGPKPWPRFHREMHAPARQLWELCLEVAERMHQTAQGYRFETDEFTRDYNTRIDNARCGRAPDHIASVRR
jgi:hypothetical protein